MKKTSKILVVAVAILAATTLVSAALLPYFGKVNTTMTTQQSVEVGDGEKWYNWNEPVLRPLGEVVHCTDYCYKLWIRNRACVNATVNFTDICTAAPKWKYIEGEDKWVPDGEGINITHFVFGDNQTIRLVQKQIVWGQSPWGELEDGMEAYLTFNTCGETFTWSIESEDNLEGYVLIYYANYPEYWDAAPAFVLGGLSGSVDDVLTMPYPKDENAQRPIIDEGETYDHQYGAKFWLVPAGALTEGNNGYNIKWGMASQFLFETDLGFYLDCDDMNPACLWNVFDAFQTFILKAESKYCWISCYHVAFKIYEGEYTFQTIVDAEPVGEEIPQ